MVSNIEKAKNGNSDEFITRSDAVSYYPGRLQKYPLERIMLRIYILLYVSERFFMFTGAQKDFFF
jgi:hypothetical protein